MASETFEKKIYQELTKLNTTQAVNFAWRCAVRALPFCGSIGSFSFWNKNERQKHIYAIFYALDVNAYFSGVAYEAVDAAAEAAEAANAAIAAATRAGARSEAARAVDAAACAARAAATDAAARAYAARAAVARATSRAEAARAVARAASAANVKNMDLESIILQDLEILQKKEVSKYPQNCMARYGMIFKRRLKPKAVNIGENCIKASLIIGLYWIKMRLQDA
ncbi:MAG: hypothetical protein ACMUHX_06050 [bacterium]